MVTLLISIIKKGSYIVCSCQKYESEWNVICEHKPLKASFLMLKYLVKIREKLNTYKKVVSDLKETIRLNQY